MLCLKVHFPVCTLLDQLPRASVDLLRHLFRVLHNTEQHSSFNQMTAYNLSRCLAPSLLGPPNATSSQSEEDFTKKQNDMLCLKCIFLVCTLSDQLPRANVLPLNNLFRVLHNTEQHSLIQSDDGYNLSRCLAPSLLGPLCHQLTLKEDFTKR
ncbi:Rho GTPase-activating protein 20 [Camelus dromedarius]|uniref:Rho GTPase-activating protein 20 n=1 Tax=Camelus dromedarius TaxID=9838 RepID=A0A5N4CAL2_CAMDR|nr:Rho GTPase-activating protein 20 [Camelus dromedarius]